MVAVVKSPKKEKKGPAREPAEVAMKAKPSKKDKVKEPMPMTSGEKKTKGKAGRPEALPVETVAEVALKRKWEKRTGVPDSVVSAAYLGAYRKQDGAMSVDELRVSPEEMAKFVKLLPEQYRGVDPGQLGKQLESLRKTGSVKLGTGRSGPSKGYKERVLVTLRNVLTEVGLAQDKQDWVLEQVDKASKEGLTPTQVKILQVLRDNPDGLTKKEIADRAGVSINLTNTLGRSDGADEGDTHSLAALGYVKASVENEGRKTVVLYAVTVKGKKAIE